MSNYISKKQVPLFIAFFIFTTITSCGLFKKEEVALALTANDFIGRYRVQETCEEENFAYNITISKIPDEETLFYIVNFFDYEMGIVMEVIDWETGAIEIPIQRLEDGYEEYVFGTGVLKDNVLTIDFAYRNPSVSLGCKAICTKE